MSRAASAIGLRPDRHGGGRHEVAGDRRLRLASLLASGVALEEVGLEHRRVLTQHQVGLGDHAHDEAVGVGDRQRADAVFPHRAHDLFEGR
jgi:hypothetical protein